MPFQKAEAFAISYGASCRNIIKASRLLVPSVISICIRSAAGLDELVLLIVGLALLAPFWGLIFATLFLFITLFLGLVYRATVVLRRAVYSHQLEWLGLRCIDELVLGTGRYDNDIGCFDVLREMSTNAPWSQHAAKRFTWSLPATVALPSPLVKIKT